MATSIVFVATLGTHTHTDSHYNLHMIYMMLGESISLAVFDVTE